MPIIFSQIPEADIWRLFPRSRAGLFSDITPRQPINPEGEQRIIEIALTLICHGAPELRDLLLELQNEGRIAIKVVECVREVAAEIGIELFDGMSLTNFGTDLELRGEQKRTYRIFLDRSLLHSFGETALALLEQTVFIQRVEAHIVLRDPHRESVTVLHRTFALGEQISEMLREDATRIPDSDSPVVLESARQLDSAMEAELKRLTAASSQDEHPSSHL